MSKLNLSEFLIECTNIESTTGNEGMFATFLATFMRNHGWKVIEQNVENDRKNLLIYLESVKNVQTVFCSHLDTVEPYIAPKREGEIIWGRGSNDAKGQISAMIAMALDLQAKSIEIAKKIGLLFTVDEELDRCGIKKTNEIEELNPEYFIIGEPTENHWGTIQKGGLKVHLKVTGKAGHSSYPDTGESAIHKLVEVLGDISKHSWPKKETGATTFNIGYIEGGEKSVPATWASKASAIIFFRTVTSNSEVLAELKRLIKDRAECEILVNVEPEYLMSRPEAFNQIPLAPIPFTTDLCHYQRKSNFKGAVVYGAGSAKNAHSEHEHVKLCDLEEAVKVYANLATYFSGEMLARGALHSTRLLSTSKSLEKQVQNVTIIGAGLMGSGIAQVSAQSKINVVLADQSDAALQKAQKGIHSSLARVAKKKFAEDASAQNTFIEGTTKFIKTTTNIDEAVKDADLVIEAIVENIDVKRKLFAQLEKSAKSDAILTTNTSSLKLADIGVNLKNKKNFGGLHFFNPVPMMKLLEVVRHGETSDETFKTLQEYGKAIGKTTVACKDTPGFIVNRLLVPYLFEALRMAERGDASMEDIDIAMKLGAGYPMGPFELTDYVGLDTSKFIMDGWNKAYPNDPTFKPCDLLTKKVAEGKLGRKSGEGFYKYK